ncbi:MAG: two-component regulator propeller domain-containing protein, partial [Ignavibacteriaceae bacterium]
MRLIILFCCFALSFLYSQSTEKWRNFTTSNSPLTKEWISCFCEDNDGKIYIGSSNNFCPLSGCGIYTYTNKNLMLLNESDSLESITDMIKTSDGSIIFSTYDCIYTIVQNNIFNLDTLNLIENNPGIISIETNDNEEIFLGTIEGRLLVIREKQIFELNSENSILGKGSIYDLIFYDSVLFIGSNDGLFTFNNNELSAIEGPQYISSFAVDKNNLLWIGSYLSGLFVYKESQVSNVLRNTSVCSIEIDENNYQWLGGYVSGLLKFDSNLKLIVDTLNTSNSDIASNCIQSLYIDVKGNIWIGTFNNGVSVYNENGLTIDSPNEWDFNVIAGVSNATAEYYGGNEVENLIYNQFQAINERFKYAFAKK